MIETHDYEVKLKQVKKFLEQGNKVKLTMRFKGRELNTSDLGKQVLTRIIEDLGDNCKVDADIKLEGKQMTAMIAPNK